MSATNGKVYTPALYKKRKYTPTKTKSMGASPKVDAAVRKAVASALKKRGLGATAIQVKHHFYTTSAMSCIGG